jgi:hypothetical protein
MKWNQMYQSRTSTRALDLDLTYPEAGETDQETTEIGLLALLDRTEILRGRGRPDVLLKERWMLTLTSPVAHFRCLIALPCDRLYEVVTWVQNCPEGRTLEWPVPARIEAGHAHRNNVLPRMETQFPILPLWSIKQHLGIVYRSLAVILANFFANLLEPRAQSRATHRRSKSREKNCFLIKRQWL